MRKISEVLNGSIVEDDVELPSDKYEVGEYILVKESGKLIVKPGTEFYFKENTGIVVFGTLLAEGSAENKIVFTELEEDKGWRNITFAGEDAPKSLMDHCLITKGRGYSCEKENYIKEFFDNDRMIMGGGLAVVSSNPVFNNCDIKNNGNDEDRIYGGGVLLSNSSTKFTDCNFEENVGFGGGGVAVWYGSKNIFDNCIFKKNRSYSTWNYIGGGGCYCVGSSDFNQCEFEENESKTKGGGLCFWGDNDKELELSFNKCKITGNRAEAGGGIFTRFNSPVIRESRIAGNKANYGGAIGSDSSDFKVFDTYIGKNIAEDNAGAGYLEGKTTPTFSNCIFENNSSPGAEKYPNCRHNFNFTNSIDAVFNECSTKINTEMKEFDNLDAPESMEIERNIINKLKNPLFIKPSDSESVHRTLKARDLFKNNIEENCDSFLPLLTIELKEVDEELPGQVHFVYHEANRGEISFKLSDCEGISKLLYEGDYNFDDGGMEEKEVNNVYFTLEDAGASENNLKTRNKIGGLPDWTTGSNWPVCPECRKEMLFIGQIMAMDFSDEVGDFDLFLFYCNDCKIQTQIEQCT